MAEIRIFEFWKFSFFGILWRQVTKNKKLIMQTYKPYFYALIFQISMQSDQKWLRYAFSNFENCRFWGLVTSSHDEKMENIMQT